MGARASQSTTEMLTRQPIIKQPTAVPYTKTRSFYYIYYIYDANATKQAQPLSLLSLP